MYYLHGLRLSKAFVVCLEGDTIPHSTFINNKYYSILINLTLYVIHFILNGKMFLPS